MMFSLSIKAAIKIIECILKLLSNMLIRIYISQTTISHRHLARPSEGLNETRRETLFVRVGIDAVVENS